MNQTNVRGGSIEKRGGFTVFNHEVRFKDVAQGLLVLATILAACAPAAAPQTASRPDTQPQPGITAAPKPATAIAASETQKQIEQPQEPRVKVFHFDAQGGISPLSLNSEKRVNVAILGGTSPEPQNAEALTPENLKPKVTTTPDKEKENAEIKIAEIKTNLEKQLADLAQNEKVMPFGYKNALVISQAFTPAFEENAETPWVGAALVDQNGKIVEAVWQPLDGGPIGPGNINGRTITADGEVFWADTYGTFVRARQPAIGENLTGKMLLQLPTYSFNDQNEWSVSRTEPMIVTKMFDPKTGVEGIPPQK